MSAPTPAAERPWKVDTCGSCHRPVIWAETERGKRMPVDAEPPLSGANVELVWRGSTVAPLAKVLTVAKQFGKRNLRLSHFATCPNAQRHRQAGKGRLPS